MLLLLDYIFIRNGSLIVEYEVTVPIRNTSKTNLIAIDENLNKAATNWTNFDGEKVDIERTKKAIKSNSLSDVTSSFPIFRSFNMYYILFKIMLNDCFDIFDKEKFTYFEFLFVTLSFRHISSKSVSMWDREHLCIRK